MTRRLALASLAGLTAACAASVDLVSFDRGAFAIAFTKLVTQGLDLLNAAIAKGTKKDGTLTPHAQQLTVYRDAMISYQKAVEQAILDAPKNAQQASAKGLSDIADVLSKAIPFILPLLAA